jgi:hypothetical protein
VAGALLIGAVGAPGRLKAPIGAADVWMGRRSEFVKRCIECRRGFAQRVAGFRVPAE